MSVSSSSLHIGKNGGGGPKLVDTGVLSIHQGYRIAWKRDAIDYTELARKRWVEKWALERLAVYLDCGRTTVIRALREIRKKPELVDDSPIRQRITHQSKFRGKLLE